MHESFIGPNAFNSQDRSQNDTKCASARICFPLCKCDRVERMVTPQSAPIKEEASLISDPKCSPGLSPAVSDFASSSFLDKFYFSFSLLILKIPIVTSVHEIVLWTPTQPQLNSFSSVYHHWCYFFFFFCCSSFWTLTGQLASQHLHVPSTFLWFV